MKRGFNGVWSIWKRILSDPIIRVKVAAWLKELGPNNNVLRFPTGMETIVNNIFISGEEVRDFGLFCREAGVKEVFFRADITNIPDSFRQYEILKDYVSIPFIEAHNEPFYKPFMLAKTNQERKLEFFQNLLGRWYRGYDEYVSSKYADMALEMSQYYSNKLGKPMANKFAFAIYNPSGWIKKIWYDAVKNKLKGFGAVCIHTYGSGESDDDLLKENRIGYDVLGTTWERVCTEESAQNHGEAGKDRYVATFDELRKRNDKIVEQKEEYGFTYVLQHMIASEDKDNLFARLHIDYDKGTITDRMIGWK